ncbi:IS200/IS605 family transposase [Nitrosomonas communis]|uniref:Putative transposase n=1 Tax=Nitrosomonas communis TaxID=44574 RepID=A0A1I4RF47_9PROT|nr:IS200/IS605 family transposase [Nitrosomonas communis]SFM50543.1 putative transposase [Nitrosomonas communis]
MRDYQSLTHTTWDCKYYVVFIPKRRKKVIFGMIRKHLGKVLRELAEQKNCQIVEGHLMPDHVHMCISIPPKYSVSYVVGYIKGKSAISIARKFMGRSRNFTGESFWARGYFVSTVGLDEEMVREYIQHQEKEDEHFVTGGLGIGSFNPTHHAGDPYTKTLRHLRD